MRAKDMKKFLATIIIIAGSTTPFAGQAQAQAALPESPKSDVKAATPGKAPVLTDKQVIQVLKFANKITPIQQAWQKSLEEYQKLSREVCGEPPIELKLPTPGTDEQPICAMREPQPR